MEALRHNAKRAKTAILLIWIVFFIQIISAFSDLFQYDLLQTVAGGNTISQETASANDIRQRVIAVLFGVAYLISGITFIQWFRRAYYNLHLRLEFLEDSEGWAAGWWFVPIGNLYKPYRIMKELYYETAVLLTKNSEGFVAKNPARLLGWWWALWIINSFVSQASFRYSLHADSITELSNSTVLSIIDSVIGLVLAVITVKVVHDYSGLESLLAEVKEIPVAADGKSSEADEVVVSVPEVD